MKTIISDKLFDVDVETSRVKEAFILPPFSILDTTSGDWLKRKNDWKRLGIKSEVGRGDNLLSIDCDEVKNHNNKFGKCNPVIYEVYYGKKIQETSVFDPVLCELMYIWFMPKNENKILDCFSGGSVRGIVASVLGKNYTGIDLREEQIVANEKNFSDIKQVHNDLKFEKINWICGDSLNVKKLAGETQYDFLFSCPPYYDLEIYSDKENDLSNIGEYEDFLHIYEKIIFDSCSLLKENRFACFVVSEIRDKKGIYRNFVSDTINAFKKSGLQYYNEMILVNSCLSLPIRINKCFNSGRKIGRRHQNVLVFYKGNVKDIKDIFGNVIVE